MLQSTGPQRVRRDLVAEQQQCSIVHTHHIFFIHSRTPHMHTHHTFFIHSSVDGHLDCFHVVANVNCAAVNIGMLISFQITVFCGYVPRIGISGSYGSSF